MLGEGRDHGFHVRGGVGPTECHGLDEPGVCVCVCVCVYVCVYMCMCVHMYMYLCVHACSCVGVVLEVTVQ